MGKQILLQANIEGDKNVKYGLAIALLCESNDEGIQLLLSILNQPDGKQSLQNSLQKKSLLARIKCPRKNSNIVAKSY